MQQALRCQANAFGQLAPARPCAKHSLRLRVVTFAEGPGGKQIREYREDTGEVTVPGENKQQQGQNNALYADQVAMVSKIACAGCFACTSQHQ